jgi:glutathione S-transferase
MQDNLYKLHGALGSPYSIKMRALLRYRRLPHIWLSGGSAADVARKHMKAPVIPVLEYPDGSFKNDSTPLIYELEARHPNQRSIVPDDPADAFLAYLLEDFGDEWLTKAMFHYRWFLPRDQQQMSHWLPFDSMQGGGLDRIETAAKFFRDRQVGRMALVGCTAENQALIETSTRRVLGALEGHVVNGFHLFGSRPSMAEFGIYGQLSQLGVDPTAQAMMRADFPYTYRWMQTVDDMSGIEGEWRNPTTPRAPVIKELLHIVGDVYMPFLNANAAAIAAGNDTMRFEALGMSYAQQPFKYQVKCLADLRAAFQALPLEARTELEPLLAETNCLATLAST